MTANFGDEIGPWLFGKMSGRPVSQATGDSPAYISVGSIIDKVRAKSVVWGAGSFGTEGGGSVNTQATYLAVRGPLTRSKLLHYKVNCPRIYGDPALLVPYYFAPQVEQTHEIGLVLRWSDHSWLKRAVGPGVKIINLGTTNVEGVIKDMLSCKRIITSSLHGLIVSDAYGIPSAWLSSMSPRGHEFKFYDYFLSVNKIRHATVFDFGKHELDVETLDAHFQYDGRAIEYCAKDLLDVCPVLKKA